MNATPEKPVILLAGQDEANRRVLQSILATEKCDLQLASNIQEALARAAEHTPDLVIIDISVSPMSGLEVCRRLCLSHAMPILVVAANDDESLRVAAFDQGADQYVVKPFSARELRARVRSLLRRAVKPAMPPPAIQAGDLEIDLARRRVFRAGREIKLTNTEFDLLVCLAQNVNNVTRSKLILHKVWGPGYGDTQTLRVHVAHLRKKIEPDPAAPRYILTEQGVGYRLVAPPNAKKAKPAGAS